MHHSSLFSSASSLALLLSEASAIPYAERLTQRSCDNSAADRSCWGDYNWGDTVVVHLTNGLANNGTGLHFHGMRQNYTNPNDGVPSITQCAVAPGDSITYTWRATQYGSSWYHSHFALQAWEGVLGGILINGPATGNYDNDMGHMFLNDWTHETVDALYSTAETSGPPTLSNGLINGTNTYPGDTTQGARFETTVTEGESYRIRLVNGAIDTHFKYMIDNHTMTVIAMDLVPITPYATDVLSLGMGQRYDVIVNMNQTAGDYWIRAIPQTYCSDNDNADDIKGILRYDSTSASDPTTSAYDYTDDCDDEAMTDLVPYYSMDAEDATTSDDEAVSVGKSGSIFKWYMAATTFAVTWEDPTLLQIYEDPTSTSWTDSQHVVQLDTADEWVYFVITTTQTIPHPIHLHGHDFYILAQAEGAYSDTTTLTLTNPPRRDTAMLPASGYLVIAFTTDNPGAWLMHCHIGWHTSEGFALQLVERQSEIPDLMDYDSFNSTCANWNTYAEESGVEVEDSGV
ncbi:putative laccase-2 [Amylocarpus encephaloides]|uniref:laccase n=1 Tax=Amylocarpus encephaloides TaxID=45428 RepID=A0A9P7YEZ5_9HELO|nr:putative laccase-2 [Amylocarpus encephaloides]